MIRRVAARALNRVADILFRLGDRFVRLAFWLDPTNDLVAGLAEESETGR